MYVGFDLVLASCDFVRFDFVLFVSTGDSPYLSSHPYLESVWGQKHLSTSSSQCGLPSDQIKTDGRTELATVSAQANFGYSNVLASVCRYVQQGSDLWGALHAGRLTTSRAKDAVGLAEPLSSPISKAPRVRGVGDGYMWHWGLLV